MRIAVEHHFFCRQLQGTHGVRNVALVAIDHGQRFGGYDRQLMIGQVDDLIGVARQWRGVAGDQVLAVAHADDQRAAQPRGNHHVGIIAKQHDQPVGTLQLGNGPSYGLDERTVPRCHGAGAFEPTDRDVQATGELLVQATGHQVGDHFGIGSGTKRETFALQACFERAEVFDHAVVDHGNGALGPANVRMGVGVGRRAVRRPAGVANADIAGRGMVGQLLRQHGEPACPLGHQQRIAVDRGDTGAVITAIFEAPQAVEQVGGGVARPDISDNSTHGTAYSGGVFAAFFGTDSP